MSPIRTTALLLLVIAAAPGQDDQTRVNKGWGVSLKLPRGFAWAAASGIGVKLDLQLDGREESITGELFCTPSAFVGTRIDEIEAEARRNPADHKDLQVKDGRRFGSQRNVVLVSYVKERGSDPVRLYDRRHWIFRRNNMLYEWREEWPRGATGRAASLASVHRSMKFTSPQGVEPPDKQRDYVGQRVRFKLPPDWVWQAGKRGRKVRVALGESGVRLFTVHTEMLVKGQRWRLFFGLQAFKAGSTVDQMVQFNKNQILKDWKEIKDYELEDKVRFAGAKAQRISFTGVNEKTGTKERIHASYTFFKHKGTMFSCFTQAPARGRKDARRAFRKAAKGLKIY